jgi:hypothetical protein
MRCAALLATFVTAWFPGSASAQGPGTLTFPAPLEVDATDAEPGEVPVFFLLGQSNAVGPAGGFLLANPFFLGGRYYPLHEQVDLRIWWPGNTPQRPRSPAAWEHYKTGFFDAVNNSSHNPIEGGYGPEAAFGAAAIQSLGKPIFLFKFTRIVALHPDAQPTFSKRSDRETVYDDLIGEWRKASDALRAAGLVPKVMGAIWVHGEADFPPSLAPTYGQHLVTFLTDIRRDVLRMNPDNGPMRWIVSELHDRHVPANFFDQAEAEIRAGQLHAVRTVPDSVLVDTDDLGLDLGSPNYVHFDPLGVILLGERMFTAWRRADTDR